jgi:hypothetical protein
MGGMKLFFQSALLMAHRDGEHLLAPDVNSWWLIPAWLLIMAACWLVLSRLGKVERADKCSLWKDENSEMDSGPDSY